MILINRFINWLKRQEMRTSNKGIDLIKEFEGLHDGDLSIIGLQPKMCPAGIWTQGYGHAIIYNKEISILVGV